LSVFWTGVAIFLSSSASFILTRAEWNPFQTHCYSKKSGSAGNRTQDLWDEIGRACRTHFEKNDACRIMVGKPEVKRPLEKPRYGWVDNIKMNLREIGSGVDWINVNIGTDVGSCEHGAVSVGSGVCW
jgi:hypothetical protein